jgi:hypothetical protein
LCSLSSSPGPSPSSSSGTQGTTRTKGPEPQVTTVHRPDLEAADDPAHRTFSTVGPTPPAHPHPGGSLRPSSWTVAGPCSRG